MRPVPRRRVLGSFLAIVLLAPGGATFAGAPPSARMLEKHGLKRSGSLFVLDAEQAVHEKADELRDLSRDWSHAVARQRATVSEKEYQDTIKELTAELNQLRAQSNLTSQNLARIPRRRGYPVYLQQFQELTVYKNQLQMEMTQRTSFLNQLKSQPFDPKARSKADAEAREREEATHQGAVDLRKAVDEVRAKYQEVQKDPDVKKWLEIPEGTAHVKPKLGPSRAFLHDEKLLEGIERRTASDDPAAPAHKGSRKVRRTTKARRSAPSSAADSPF